MWFFAKRLGVAATRLLIAEVLILLLIEMAFVVLGSSTRHVWDFQSLDFSVPTALSSEDTTWTKLILSRCATSAFPVALAFFAVVFVGYFWGVLGARLRNIRITELISAPLGILAVLPPFWMISSSIVFSLQIWNRPGFSDELVLGTGYSLLDLWHGTVIAFVLVPFPLMWVLRNTTTHVSRMTRRPYLASLFYRGHRNDHIFYRNIVRQAKPELYAIAAKSLSPILGGLVAVEYAFRYPGIGALLVDVTTLGNYEGIAAICFTFALILIFTNLVREIIVAVFFHRSIYVP